MNQTHIKMSLWSSWAELGNLKTVGNHLIELDRASFLKSGQMGKEKLDLNFKLLEVLKRQ